jgi:hypothetical protein
MALILEGNSIDCEGLKNRAFVNSTEGASFSKSEIMNRAGLRALFYLYDDILNITL